MVEAMQIPKLKCKQTINPQNRVHTIFVSSFWLDVSKMKLAMLGNIYLKEIWCKQEQLSFRLKLNYKIFNKV
jgi:hypothetical protein